MTGLTARDVPAPASLAEDAAEFPGIVYGLIAQPRLRVAGHGASGANGVKSSISISYSYLDEPDEPDAAVNFVENIGEVRGWMQKAELDQQPDRFRHGVAAARYPMLWEAVLTTVDPGSHRSLEEHLADHVNHLMINTMEHRRIIDAGHISALDHAVRATHAQPAELTVDGDRRSRLTIDTDPDIVGWATRLEDAIVILGLPRNRTDHLTLELGSAPTTDPA